jgi:hypothetical protein
LFWRNRTGRSRQRAPKLQIKPLNLGTNTALSGNPNNHGNNSNSKPLVFDDFTLNMIKALFAKKHTELKK